MKLEKEINNQDKSSLSSHGGKRKGSGRKQGESPVTTLKRKFKDYVDEDKVEELVIQALEQSKTKSEMLKFVLEQLFGKAPQSVELEGQAKFILEIAKTVADKNE